jgi:hypothetical protein
MKIYRLVLALLGCVAINTHSMEIENGIISREDLIDTCNQTKEFANTFKGSFSSIDFLSLMQAFVTCTNSIDFNMTFKKGVSVVIPEEHQRAIELADKLSGDADKAIQALNKFPAGFKLDTNRAKQRPLLLWEATDLTWMKK